MRQKITSRLMLKNFGQVFYTTEVAFIVEKDLVIVTE